MFKRAVDKNYMLKMRASRYVFNEVNHRFPTLPFTLRALEDEKQARMGVVECLKHDLLHQYPVRQPYCPLNKTVPSHCCSAVIPF